MAQGEEGGVMCESHIRAINDSVRLLDEKDAEISRLKAELKVAHKEMAEDTRIIHALKAEVGEYKRFHYLRGPCIIVEEKVFHEVVDENADLRKRVGRLTNAVTCAEDYLKGKVHTSVEHLLVVLEKAKGE